MTPEPLDDEPKALPQVPPSPFEQFKKQGSPPPALKSDSGDGPAEKLARLLNEGTAERRKGEFKKAIVTFTAAIEAAPTSAAAFAERGLSHLGAGSNEAAIADFSKALALAGDKGSKSVVVFALINRGLAYMQLDMIEVALADLDKAIKLDPENATAFANRALVQVRRKSADKALADAQRAIELKPGYEFGHYVRGAAYNEKAQYELAISDFLKVLETLPEHRSAIFGLKRADLRGKEQEGEGSVSLVRSADGACEPSCAEWISIQGHIAGGLSDKLKGVLKGLGGRKVPVFVNSGGGSVQEAMEMGRAIRAAGLDVAVTHTTQTQCGKDDAACKKRAVGGKILGTARGAGAVCASSCGFLLASGVRRYVGKSSMVGIHQITSFQTYQKVYRQYEVRKGWRDGKLVEIDRRLISEERGEKTTVQTRTEDTTYARVRTYYTEMGTDASIMSLLVSAPPKGMYWLTSADFERTRARTDVADGVALLAAGPQAVPAPVHSPAASVPQQVTVYTLPADSDAVLVKAIQVQLTRIGCLAGTEDGKWGAGVRRALERYNTLTGKPLGVDAPSGETLDALSSQKGLVCPPQCPPGMKEADRQCVKDTGAQAKR